MGARLLISSELVCESVAGSLRFFFSSRRRHTRYIGDWSSDVCSSDLGDRHRDAALALDRHPVGAGAPPLAARLDFAGRSEERRVGKECRSRWAADDEKKETKIRE